MKKLSEYSCRGVVADGEVERITLFDGRFDTAYKVIDFEVWQQNPLSTNDGIAMLGTVEDSVWDSAPTLDASVNTQIAWSGFSTGTYIWANHESIIDPDNLIVEDLFMHAQITGSGTSMSYLIKLEKYDISDWQGALAMVRNRAQGSLT